MSMWLVRRTDPARRSMVEIDGLWTADPYVVTFGAYGIGCPETAPDKSPGASRPRVGQTLLVKNERRPWGHFEILSDAPTHKVKRLTVEPGHRLSYQRHTLRSEHWFVVGGTAVVTLDGHDSALPTGSAIDVPVGTAHRIENRGSEALVFIEVQHGRSFGEDDIERLDDDYGRLGPD
jgi:mannose-6-phosphate isomerase